MVWPVTGNPEWQNYEIGGTRVWAENLNAIEQAVQDARGQVFFGSNANTARPPTTHPILWIGYSGIVPTNAIEDYDLIFSFTASLIEATAAAPSFDDTADTYTIPTTTGVQYKVGGVTTSAGVYSVGDVNVTITITAEALTGYTLIGTSEWVYSFNAVSGGLTHFTDFSEYTTGVAPSDWTDQWAAFDTLQVQDDAGALSGKVLRLVSTSVGRRAVTWDDVLNDAEIDLLIRFKWVTAPSIGSDNYGMHMFRARVSGAAATETGVGSTLLGMINTDLYHSSAAYSAGSVISSGVASVNTGKQLVADTWFWARMHLTGRNLKQKFWTHGESEPGTWGVDITYPVDLPQSGAIGLGAFQLVDVMIDRFGVGLGGAVAPAS